MITQPAKKLRWPEAIYAGSLAVVLLWINGYICHELFTNVTGHMNSMQGFWAGLARLGGDSWFHSSWWPYWDCGIPFEFTYAPMVPLLTAICATVRGVPHILAIESVSGLAYCLVPLTLFVMAWVLTRSPGYSFLASLLYSLTSWSQLVAPDEAFAWKRILDARRLYLVSVWDETPHVLELAWLPLAILFLALSIRHRRLPYCIGAVVTVAAASLTSAFGPTTIAMAAICLLAVLREEWPRSLATVAGIAIWAYVICSPFLSPAILKAMRLAANETEGAWSLGSFTAVAIVVSGWIIVHQLSARCTQDWRVRFFALFAWLMGSIPAVAGFFHRQFLPQPVRYKMELELSLALLLVFGLRPWLEKVSWPVKAALLLLVAAMSGEQIANYREFALKVLQPADATRSIEYRASTWAASNLPGVRVMMPGSIAQWTNTFTEIPQLFGSSWSMAYNRTHQRAIWTMFSGDATVAIPLLQAYGAGAVTVTGPQSQETWKPFKPANKFDGVLPVLWSADDVTIYRVPQRSASLAHVVPESAVMTRFDRLQSYVAALNDPALPLAESHWEGCDRLRVAANLASGQALAIQVSYNSGWHAQVQGQAQKLNRDALGLMWLRPDCTGACDVQLDYTGNWQLHLGRAASAAGILGLVVLPIIRRRRKPVTNS